MRVSHRDLRVTRDIHRAAWGMLGLAVVLSAGALYFPFEALRFGAVVGLAGSGAAYIWRSGVAVEGYLNDVESVAAGREVPGHVRVEVESNVGYSNVAPRTSSPSPHARRRPAVPRATAPLPGESDRDEPESR